MAGNSHVTIADVARAANVSRTLVSFVLNGRKDVAPGTRVRILQAIEELGYRPNAVARNLARKRAGAIGIVCDMETYQDPLDMQFLAAILATASEMEQRVMLIPSDDRQIQEVAQDHAVDGVIFLDERVSDPRRLPVRLATESRRHRGHRRRSESCQQRKWPDARKLSDKEHALRPPDKTASVIASAWWFTSLRRHRPLRLDHPELTSRQRRQWPQQSCHPQ